MFYYKPDGNINDMFVCGQPNFKNDTSVSTKIRSTLKITNRNEKFFKPTENGSKYSPIFKS